MKNLTVILFVLLIGACSTVPPTFVNISKYEINKYIRSFEISIIPVDNLRFKIYRISNGDIAIVSHREGATITKTVDIKDLDHAIFMTPAETIEFTNSLTEIIEQYEKPFVKGKGQFYEYVILSNNVEQIARNAAFRIQLKIEDMEEKSDKPWKQIVLEILGNIEELKIEDIKILRNALL